MYLKKDCNVRLLNFYSFSSRIGGRGGGVYMYVCHTKWTKVNELILIHQPKLRENVIS